MFPFNSQGKSLDEPLPDDYTLQEECVDCGMVKKRYHVMRGWLKQFNAGSPFCPEIFVSKSKLYNNFPVPYEQITAYENNLQRRNELLSFISCLITYGQDWPYPKNRPGDAIEESYKVNWLNVDKDLSYSLLTIGLYYGFETEIFKNARIFWEGETKQQLIEEYSKKYGYSIDECQMIVYSLNPKTGTVGGYSVERQHVVDDLIKSYDGDDEFSICGSSGFECNSFSGNSELLETWFYSVYNHAANSLMKNVKKRTFYICEAREYIKKLKRKKFYAYGVELTPRCYYDYPYNRYRKNFYNPLALVVAYDLNPESEILKTLLEIYKTHYIEFFTEGSSSFDGVHMGVHDILIKEEDDTYVVY